MAADRRRLTPVRAIPAQNRPRAASYPAGTPTWLSMLIGLRGDLGLDSAITEAHRGIRVTAGLNDEPSNHCGSAPAIPLVHPDLPHWFRSNEQLLHLRLSAEALRQ